jgi:MscS family membrane protein
VLALALIAVVGHAAMSLLLSKLRRAAEASNSRWDDAIVYSLHGPAEFAWWLLLVSLLFALLPALAPWRGIVTEALQLALVLLVPWFLHRLISNIEAAVLLERYEDGTSSDKATVHATARLLRITLWLIAALTALQTLGVSVSGLLAFGGIGGIAVGFAAKDLLANFFGGLGIYLDRPFTLGDWIRSPDRSIEGVVEDIGWRITRIRTFDKRPLYVPNSVFSQISIENPSRMLNRRIYERFGVRYGDSRALPQIISDVEAMLRAHDEIDQQQTIIANFEAFGASSLDCFIYCLTRTTNWVEYHAVKQDVLLRVLAIVHEQGADIAFPTRTLQIDGGEPPPL